ncbi:MAG: UPF0149 family protein [Cellvibrionaceae bacterium]|nr:UPF0149 family protein [Cellvibrionaceae bacterium]
MNTLFTTDFDELSDLLLSCGVHSSPSELHGFLCGRFCGGATPTASEWIAQSRDLLSLSPKFNRETKQCLQTVHQQTASALRSGDYQLQLLLPDDDTELEQRTQALAQWCHGFLLGFGSAGIDPNTEFSSEQADALKDLASIVQATVDEDKDEMLQERDLVELEEYVRIVALNFYEDCAPITPTAATAPKVH